MTTFLAQTLIDQGYIGATGATPYRPATTEQVDVLRSISDQSFAGLVSGVPSPTAIHININFDGTQNNGAFVADGESSTNVWQLSKLQRDATGDLNTIYIPGIGAQTLPSGTLDANGNPAPGSSPSNWESTPWKAGEIGNVALEGAYFGLIDRVSAVLLENPNAEIALNLAGFSRGSAEAVAFANLLNERGIVHW